MKHNAGHQNEVVDVLSKRAQLLVILRIKVTGFEELQPLYAIDEGFQ